MNYTLTITTDNPQEISDFLLSAVPSLKATTANVTVEATPEPLPVHHVSTPEPTPESATATAVREKLKSALSTIGEAGCRECLEKCGAKGVKTLAEDRYEECIALIDIAIKTAGEGNA